MKTSYEKFMASSAVEPIKVEMALVDDLKKSAAKLNNRAMELRSHLATILQFKEMAKTAYNELLKQRQDLEVLTRNYTNSAKELGMNAQELPEVAKSKNAMAEVMKAYSKEVL